MSLIRAGFAVLVIILAVDTMAAPNTPIPETRQRAALIYQRIAGVRIAIDDPRLDAIEARVRSNDLMGAADLATQAPTFYNITVRDFALKSSTREETIRIPLNDFAATVIGTVRDNISAKELLYGNYYYQADPANAAVTAAGIPSDLVNDILKSNNHYTRLGASNLDVSSVLMRVDGQKVVNAANAAVDHPDPAGLLTSRTFMEAHAVAGTNRRLVEFTFREFLCIPIQGWADASAADNYVGRDVDRFPGGSNAKFQTTCKACHGQMDALRGAFGKFDFEDGYVKHADILVNGGAATQMEQDPVGIARKMNQNGSVFQDGYRMTQNHWKNYAVLGSNSTYFGWRNPASEGNGVNSLGQVVADARAFSKCVTKKVYRSVCKRDPSAVDDPAVQQMANEFEANQYNLKWLFKRVVSDTSCTGR